MSTEFLIEASNRVRNPNEQQRIRPSGERKPDVRKAAFLPWNFIQFGSCDWDEKGKRRKINFKGISSRSCCAFNHFTLCCVSLTSEKVNYSKTTFLFAKSHLHIGTQQFSSRARTVAKTADPFRAYNRWPFAFNDGADLNVNEKKKRLNGRDSRHLISLMMIASGMNDAMYSHWSFYGCHYSANK